MTVDRTIAEAYQATYRGPHPGAVPHVDEAGEAEVAVTPELIAAQRNLAHQRQAGETLVGVHGADDPGGFGPALQIVTDQATMLMDSVTVLLHRLGVAYVALMHPAITVRRDADGTLVDVGVDGVGPDVINESWIHVQLAKSVNQPALAEAVRLLPLVVADARQVANDSAALAATLQGLADQIDADDGTRFHGPDRGDVADLLCWLPMLTKVSAQIHSTIQHTLLSVKCQQH
jgi:glutamate dehydrogenase